MRPSEGELHPHRQNNQSHEAREGIAREPGFGGFAGYSCDKEQDQPGHQSRHRDCHQGRDRKTPESVMTPVTVPGLAVKSINGVKDAAELVAARARPLRIPDR